MDLIGRFTRLKFLRRRICLRCYSFFFAETSIDDVRKNLNRFYQQCNSSNCFRTYSCSLWYNWHGLSGCDIMGNPRHHENSDILHQYHIMSLEAIIGHPFYDRSHPFVSSLLLVALPTWLDRGATPARSRNRDACGTPVRSRDTSQETKRVAVAESSRLVSVLVLGAVRWTCWMGVG